MEINLTKDQFRILIKLLYLGEWVANGHRFLDENLKEYEEVEQHILNIAKKKGFSELAESVEDLKGVFPTQELEEEMHVLIDEHEEAMFWDKLPDWMGERDLHREFSPEALKAMGLDEYFTRLSRIVETYEHEFEEHGLERLEIRKNH